MDEQALLSSIQSIIQEEIKPIVDRLDQMDGRFDKMDERLDKMDGRFDKMDGRFDKMNGRMDEMQNDYRKLSGHVAVIENDHTTKINLILESQIAANRNIADLKERVTRVEDKLDEAVVIKVASKV